MLAVERQPSMPSGKAGYRPIIEAPASQPERKPLIFDPDKHLEYSEPEKIVMMKDIGYEPDAGISPVAVSQPFRLFSKDAVEEMRREISNPKLQDECFFRSNIAACQLRGYCPKYAPFAYDAWTHPKTLEIMSKIAGVDLVPVMNYEIGHINFSVKNDHELQSERSQIEVQKQFFASDEGIGGCPWEDDQPIVGWHSDSYPFVCVLMLSDCTGMVGGETALRTANGDVMKVRGPDMGCGVVLQGRYITHQALRALGTRERITCVTSFRPRSAHMRDDTVLTTVRPISDLSELYYEFGEYRLENLEERIRAKLTELRKRRIAGKRMEIKSFKLFLETQIGYLQQMNSEMVEEENVKVGKMEKLKIPNATVCADDDPPLAKKARI